MLLDKLAGQVMQDPAYRLKECPHPLADVKATALVLHVLTKESWDRDDITLLDALWRQATATELFGLEFEGERQCIEQCVDASRKNLGKEKLQALLW